MRGGAAVAGLLATAADLELDRALQYFEHRFQVDRGRPPASADLAASDLQSAVQRQSSRSLCAQLTKIAAKIAWKLNTTVTLTTVGNALVSVTLPLNVHVTIQPANFHSLILYHVLVISV